MNSRFVDDAFGFALTWNYWFNDAVSTASDLIALQLLLEYWTDNFPGWAISLIFLFVVIGLNVFSVKAYGEVSFFRIHARAMIVLTVSPGRILAQLVESRHHSGMWQHMNCSFRHRPNCLRYSLFLVWQSIVAETPTTSISAVKTGTLAMRHLSEALAALHRSLSLPLLPSMLTSVL